MPDSFTTTTTTGYGRRIVNSITGVVFGVLCFIASFGVLYWNEGLADLSNIAKTATEISSVTVSSDPSLSGTLVSTSGVVDSDQLIGDGMFLKPGKFLAAQRAVEMYAWKEDSSSNSQKNIGGSETTVTTYTYTKSWEASPQSSSGFQHPGGHENPTKSLDSHASKATAATIGAYQFDPQRATLPSLARLPLNSQTVTLRPGSHLANDRYLYIPKSETGTFDDPQIGDLRVSYQVLRPGFDGTIFGALTGGQINPYVDGDGNQLYRLFAGTRDQGIATFHTEYTQRLWVIRLLGLFLMWCGLSLVFGPLSVLLDILPVAGALSRLMIGVMTLAVSLVLTIVTIVVSMIAQSLIALCIALVVAIGVIIALVLILPSAEE